jgi:hypothetical protein
VYPLDRESTSKLFHRTCGKGGGRKGDGSTADRRLVFLRAHVVRVAAANNGRPQHGNRPGLFYAPRSCLSANQTAASWIALEPA